MLRWSNPLKARPYTSRQIWMRMIVSGVACLAFFYFVLGFAWYVVLTAMALYLLANRFLIRWLFRWRGYRPDTSGTATSASD